MNPTPHCVINAIFCAWTWGTFRRDPVRIAIQRIDAHTDHAQAEALVEGVWTPLTELWTGSHLEVAPWKRHYPEPDPYRYVSLRDWIDEQIHFTNQ